MGRVRGEETDDGVFQTNLLVIDVKVGDHPDLVATVLGSVDALGETLRVLAGLVEPVGRGGQQLFSYTVVQVQPHPSRLVHELGTRDELAFWSRVTLGAAVAPELFAVFHDFLLTVGTAEVVRRGVLAYHA